MLCEEMSFGNHGNGKLRLISYISVDHFHVFSYILKKLIFSNLIQNKFTVLQFSIYMISLPECHHQEEMLHAVVCST